MDPDIYSLVVSEITLVALVKRGAENIGNAERVWGKGFVLYS